MAAETRAGLLEDFRAIYADALALAGGQDALWPAPYSEDSPDGLIAFLTECCWTLDEETSEISQIPDLPHVRFFGDVWHLSRATGKTLLIEKSRRILVSWILSACELWSMGLKQEGRVVSGLNYAKTSQQVWRTAWLYRQARHRKFSKLRDCTPRGGSYTAQDVRSVILPNGSMIQGLNQESDTFQGSGYAGIRLEELSHFDHVGAMLGQSYIITHGRADAIGGHVVGVCNAFPEQEWQEAKKIAKVVQNNDPTWLPEIPDA